MDLCPKVKNILLLDSEGKCVAAKYCTDEWPTNNAKETWARAVFAKTQKANAHFEAFMTIVEDNVVVYKFVQDLHFYVTGGENENELILATVLQGFFDAVGLLLRDVVDKSQAFENLNLILLCIDEIVDRGIILETDANIMAEKVATHGFDSGSLLSEQVYAYYKSWTCDCWETRDEVLSQVMQYTIVVQVSTTAEDYTLFLSFMAS